MTRRFHLLVAAFVLTASAANNRDDKTAVAEVDGLIITSRDLQQAGGVPMDRLEAQLYALKRQKVEELIANRLLAREALRRNISVEALIRIEVSDQAGTVTAEEIHQIYELNKNQLQKPEADVRDQVETFLRAQKAATRRQEYVKSLQAQTRVVTYLEAPRPFRAEVTGEGPVRGAPDAPVTIVEFEDFQCPFCKKAQAVMDQVLVHYKDRVRLVHRDFPLDSLHPVSRKVHEAARCAGEQGKFWEYRSLLYSGSSSANAEQLENYAAGAKLDDSAFKKCVESGKFKAAVQQDEEEGTRLGVEGTPAFFVNGRLLSGAQPESAFVQVIEEELNQRTRR
jgi:protein-disulfide isomerase